MGQTDSATKQQVNLPILSDAKCKAKFVNLVDTYNFFHFLAGGATVVVKTVSVHIDNCRDLGNKVGNSQSLYTTQNKGLLLITLGRGSCNYKVF